MERIRRGTARTSPFIGCYFGCPLWFDGVIALRTGCFLLREWLDYPYKDIAERLERTPEHSLPSSSIQIAATAAQQQALKLLVLLFWGSTPKKWS